MSKKITMSRGSTIITVDETRAAYYETKGYKKTAAASPVKRVELANKTQTRGDVKPD